MKLRKGGGKRQKARIGRKSPARSSPKKKVKRKPPPKPPKLNAKQRAAARRRAELRELARLRAENARLKLARKRARDRDSARERRARIAADPTTWTARKLHRRFPDADNDALLAYWTRELSKRNIAPNSVVGDWKLETVNGDIRWSGQTWAEYLAEELEVTQHEVYDTWLSP